ncbi:MAG: hypothetical protein IJU23_01340, partial [Proteobacteria bacterium]|nr:hypothetical protein [Pseudomonadota bacterium]
MSKKLLAILAALSVAGCVVTACGDDDNDNSGDSCTIGQKACVGTDSIKVCLNNKWSDAQKCPTGQTCSAGANGDAACGAGGGGTCTAGATMCDGNNLKVCTGTTWTSTACPTGTTCTVSGTTATCAPNGQTTCTNGQTQCVNNVSQICSNGTWTNGGNACGSTPTTDPKAGDPCDESSYPGGCSNDGTKRYYCQSGALVEKTCDGGKTCVAKGNNSSSCEGGETCTKETYQAGCTDSLNGSYCGNNGTVVTVKCTADKPCVNNDGYIKC